MMQSLDKSLRSRLERTIKDARDIAEDAARAALEQLGVGEAAPFAHLSERERELRRKLRVHGRQLGDSLNGGKIQTMDRLIEEVAYEHWHRMLFARFLAENNLLMYLEEEVSTKNTKSTNENKEENFVDFVPFVDKNLSFSSWMDLLLKNADHAGKSLETWLREKFFTQHCKLFQHRPFIWHIWDGLRDGFAALVNYHKLDAKLLETLIYTYLGDWISRQKQDIASGIDGAQERLAAAEALKKKLELILEGETPYDIFVRWKPLEKQPIGWDPDLNDGVRLNIRPFLTVPDVGKKGAGVLRDKPNINWNKDRGKDVESAPWYHVFDGDRINDHHLTLAEKKAVHEKHERHEK